MHDRSGRLQRGTRLRILITLFEPAGFLDQVHTIDSGNRTFARRIAPRVRAAIAAPLPST